MEDKLNELAKRYNNTKVKTTTKLQFDCKGVNTIISYPVESESGMGIIVELDKEISVFMDGIGYENIGGGSGFGYRDLEYQKRSKSKS